MSVDTHTNGRNLAAYRVARDADLSVYVSPVLYGMASRLSIDTAGRFVKKLVVQLSSADDAGAGHGRPGCC